MKNKKLFLFFSILVFWVLSLSGFAQQGSWKSLEEVSFEELVGSAEDRLKDQWNSSDYKKNLWTWLPSGSVQGFYSERCHPRILEEKILKNSSRGEQSKYEILKEFFSSCDRELSRGSLSYFAAYLKSSNLRFNYMKLGWAQTAIFETSKGVQIPLRLALQKTSQPRPLVVVQCGFQCDLNAPVLTRLLMNFYEEAAFHVVLLPSTSGFHIPKLNQFISVGGLVEGAGIFEILKYLKFESPFRDQISSLHLYGFSAGASSVLYAGLYAKAYSDQSLQEPLVRSSQAACGVVDLERSMKNLFSGGFVGKHMAAALAHQFFELTSYVPLLRRLLPTARHIPSRFDLSDFVSTAAQPFYYEQTVQRPWGFRPFEKMKIRDQTDFWKWHRFQNFASEKDSPVLMWSSLDDVIVLTSQNASVLESRFRNSQKSPYKVLRTRTGGHCEFHQQYTWAVSGAVERSWALSSDPVALAQRQVRRLSFQKDLGQVFEKPRPGVRLEQADWLLSEGDSSVTLRLIYLEKRSQKNSTSKSVEMKNFRWRVVRHLDPRDLGLRLNLPVSSQEEAQSLTRYLNSRLWLVGPGGAYLGTRAAANYPVELEVVTYHSRERL